MALVIVHIIERLTYLNCDNSTETLLGGTSYSKENFNPQTYHSKN